MPIEFRCTQCRRLLRTEAEAAGKKAKCPECGAILDVPSSSAPGEVTSPPPAPPGAAPPAPDAGAGDPFRPSTRPPSESASPFGPDVPLSTDSAGAENPYQSPRGVEALASGPAYQPYPDALAYASSQVSGPAIALIVTGAIGLTFQILGAVLNLVFLAVPGLVPRMPGAGPQLFMFSGGMQLFFSMISIAVSMLVIFGAWKMKNLQSYGLAMASAIIAMIPYISPCCCLGLPFGIWALVVLADSQVQAAFQAQSAQSGF